MFWGLIMEPQRRYTQKVKKAFHISMASLDISTSSEEPAQVMCGIEGRNYLLCTLRKPDVMQCPLDLNFNVGCDLSFAANGKCHVHLTGYLIEDYPEISEEEEVEEQSEEEIEDQAHKKKKRNKDTKNGPPSKKAKVSTESDNDEETSDSDVNLEDLLQKSFDEDENDDTYLEEEEDNASENEEEEDEDDDDEGEEEESSQSDSGEEEEIENSEETVIKMNGINQKSKSKKNLDKNTQAKESKTPDKNAKINESKTPNKESKAAKIANKESKSPKKKVVQGGVIIEEMREGQGSVAKAGKFITVYYEGRLKQNNKMFDSTTKGAGFSFRLGSGEVIKGWDVGVAGMKIGGKRRITCPPQMAYGAKGSPPAIPANSTLIFEVELKKVK